MKAKRVTRADLSELLAHADIVGVEVLGDSSCPDTDEIDEIRLRFKWRGGGVVGVSIRGWGNLTDAGIVAVEDYRP